MLPKQELGQKVSVPKQELGNEEKIGHHSLVPEHLPGNGGNKDIIMYKNVSRFMQKNSINDRKIPNWVKEFERDFKQGIILSVCISCKIPLHATSAKCPLCRKKGKLVNGNKFFGEDKYSIILYVRKKLNLARKLKAEKNSIIKTKLKPKDIVLEIFPKTRWPYNTVKDGALDYMKLNIIHIPTQIKVFLKYEKIIYLANSDINTNNNEHLLSVINIEKLFSILEFEVSKRILHTQ